MGSLTLLPQAGEPWNQQPGEPDPYFSQFAWWLMKTPRPSISGVEIANMWRWSDRAIAYDNHLASTGRPRDLMGKSFLALMRALAIESQHLLERVLNQPNATNALSPREIKDLLDILVAHKDLALSSLQNAGADYDTSKLSEVELRVLQAAHQVVKRTGRK